MNIFLQQPGFLGTHGTVGADLSLVLAVLFTLLFLLGWGFARKGRGQAHHLIMLGGMAAMLTYFVIYYLSRQLGALAFEGREGFGGPDSIYRWVFTPVLNLHILVVTAGIVMAVYMILLGFRASGKEAGGWVLRGGAPIWGLPGFAARVSTTSVVLALILFLIRGGFKGYSIHLMSLWLALFLFMAAMLILVEWIAGRLYPEGGRRHRVLGTWTIGLYLLALATSVTTYLMIYVLYPPVIG